MADEPLKWISNKSIYKFIYATAKEEVKKLLISHLRSKRKLRKGGGKTHNQRGGILGMYR